ncbi:MAG: glycolate oxidase subunit GlcE [Pseudomonadales bacterium]|jgi:glycolate oxidase FAD binding subunit|nr:glycolate oxidase subunit GlcE [Pseudomonadales bacterium]MDP7595385.1 glycolate oxidase subunit GlcE [Pseudomonadales bacterium]HJN53011.1 glycolate oxidase subunit GlcE [Pseudomonadales bacterium]|tara:strand:+ start:2144 stop:3238 length:1095 start_codon:yes stop_codon:yes gene_type:complete
MKQIPDRDASHDLAGAVEQACRAERALNIAAGRTKDFLGNRPDVDCQLLDISGHTGILQYDPSELILRARAGTRLAEIEELLADHGQMLPFEPPHFGPAATLGGCVAAGLSGPRRAYTGAVRDFVLGVTIINGNGEILSFGGQVMKNVAGYDVSRLMVGSMGTLAVILDVSLKVLPLPQLEKTRVLECGSENAIETMCALCGSCRPPYPVSATCYYGEQLYVRLSSTENAVQTAIEKIGGEGLEHDQRFWQEVREQRHAFFESSMNFWRLSMPPATPYRLSAGSLIEWGGAQRWLKSDAAVDVRTQIEVGHATLFRRSSDAQDHASSQQIFHPLSAELMQIHRRLKQSFDPHGLFNKGRMFRDL